jgi:hypothetical protein
MGVWSKPVRVRFGPAYEEVVVQTIGDRTAALEYGHEAMQKRLLEFRAEGERFAALTEALRLMPIEDAAAFVVEGEKEMMAERLMKERPDGVEPRRDYAAGETEEAFAARCQEWEKECEGRRIQREEELKERIRRRMDDLCALPKDEVICLARARRIDIECWNAFHQASDDWVLFEATRPAEDSSRLYFSDVEEVRGLHPEVKAQLAAAYRELERPAVGMRAAEAEEDSPASLEASLPKGFCATGGL